MEIYSQMGKSIIGHIITVTLVSIFVQSSSFAQVNSAIKERIRAVSLQVRNGNLSTIVEASPDNSLNDSISDLITSLKFRSLHPKTYSKRVQVCITNLIDATDLPKTLSAVNPAQHVGVLVDGEEEFTDPGGGGLGNAHLYGRPIVCSPAPVMQDMSEAKFAERVKCIGQEYSRVAYYSFLDYNCGGFTRDVLLASGGDIPFFPNAGLGMKYPSPLYVTDRAQIQESKRILFEKIKAHCSRD